MWLSNTDVHGCTRFVFDLEFIGDIDKDECYIWDVGCVCSDTGQTFSAVVMPPVPPAHIDAAFDNVPTSRTIGCSSWVRRPRRTS